MEHEEKETSGVGQTEEAKVVDQVEEANQTKEVSQIEEAKGVDQIEEAKEKNESEQKTAAKGESKDAAKTAHSFFSEPDNGGVRFYDIGKNKKVLNKKSSKKKNMIIFAGIIAVLIVVGVSCESMGTGFSGDESAASYPNDPYIARIYVDGVITAAGTTDYFGTPIGYQHQWTLNTIDDLIYDSNNEGLIIFVNSPGGGVYESDELYFKIKEYQEYTGRPVYSAMGTMAASGGYYISAPCDKIIANRNCLTGSIGVTMGTLFDFSELLQKYGVKTYTIASGANKSMGSSVEPLTEEQKQIFQSLVDDAYLQFVELVAEGRGMDIEKVKKIADGRIYTAKQALSLNLIDQIGTLEEAVADMQDSYELEYCEVVDLTSEGTSLWGSLFGGIDIPALTSKGDVEAIIQLMEESNQFPVSYMCETLK